jgi:hypothetical protein
MVMCDFGDSHFLFLGEVYVYSPSINGFNSSKVFYSWCVSKWVNKWLDFTKIKLGKSKAYLFSISFYRGEGVVWGWGGGRTIKMYNTTCKHQFHSLRNVDSVFIEF